MKHTTWPTFLKKPLWWLVAGLMVLATFLRLYNLEGSLLFLGDQGRDAIIVSQMFTDHDLVFIGPVMSVGNMYLGPLYYYFMLPWLWLSYPSPIGPAYAIALLGIATVWLVFWFGQKLIGTRAALIAAGLYTISATTIVFARFSWNPNPAPFVGAIMMWATYQASRGKLWYWTLVGLCFSILIQLHYLTLLSAGGAGLIYLWQLWSAWQNRAEFAWKKLVLATLAAAGIFLFSLTPLILFDIRHDWLNLRAFQSVTTEENNFTISEQVSLPVRIATTLKETHGRSMHLFFEYNLGKNRELNTILLGGLVISLAAVLVNRHHPFAAGQRVILAYVGVGILGISAYQHNIYDHHIAYLFPAVFWCLGTALDFWWQPSKKVPSWLFLPLRVGVVAFVVFFLWYNQANWPLKSMGWTAADIKATADSIASKMQPGEKYNIVLLSDSKDLYGQNYRYFLTTTDKKPLAPEQSTEAQTLVIINEDKKTRDVVNLPIYEIVTFSDKIPDEVYTIPNGPEITILRSNSP